MVVNGRAYDGVDPDNGNYSEEYVPDLLSDAAFPPIEPRKYHRIVLNLDQIFAECHELRSIRKDFEDPVIREKFINARNRLTKDVPNETSIDKHVKAYLGRFYQVVNAISKSGSRSNELYSRFFDLVVDDNGYKRFSKGLIRTMHDLVKDVEDKEKVYRPGMYANQLRTYATGYL